MYAQTVSCIQITHRNLNESRLINDLPPTLHMSNDEAAEVAHTTIDRSVAALQATFQHDFEKSGGTDTRTAYDTILEILKFELDIGHRNSGYETGATGHDIRQAFDDAINAVAPSEDDFDAMPNKITDVTTLVNLIVDIIENVFHLLLTQGSPDGIDETNATVRLTP